MNPVFFKTKELEELYKELNRIGHVEDDISNKHSKFDLLVKEKLCTKLFLPEDRIFYISREIKWKSYMFKFEKILDIMPVKEVTRKEGIAVKSLKVIYFKWIVNYKRTLNVEMPAEALKSLKEWIYDHIYSFGSICVPEFLEPELISEWKSTGTMLFPIVVQINHKTCPECKTRYISSSTENVHQCPNCSFTFTE